MSMIVDNSLFTSIDNVAGPAGEEHRDLVKLDRYLAIIESNKDSCRFVPSDAMLALDMAGFVRGHIAGHSAQGSICASRLALALVQPCQRAPVQ